jgi:hypothetical protein
MRQLKQYTIRVTPKVATEWLEANTHNRPVSDKKVRDYATAMKAGNWMLNGEPIIFDKDGVLADGQHRLWACIEANVSFETAVVEGVPKDAFATIDTGFKRGGKDVLHIDGIKRHPKAMATTIRTIIKIEAGKMLGNMIVENSDIVNYYRDHQDLCDWMELATAKKVWATAYAPHAVAVCYLAARRYPDKAREFLNSFILGENLQAGSPVLSLRNRLGTEKKLTQIEKSALIAQAWNAFIEGRKLQRMVMFTGDKFPTIKGA